MPLELKNSVYNWMALVAQDWNSKSAWLKTCLDRQNLGRNTCRFFPNKSNIYLKHWALNGILQTLFSNAFSWKKIVVFGIKFLWRLFQSNQFTTSQLWFRWLPSGWQDLINFDAVMASPCFNELRRINPPCPFKHLCLEWNLRKRHVIVELFSARWIWYKARRPELRWWPRS